MAELPTIIVARNPSAGELAASWARGSLSLITHPREAETDGPADVIVEGAFDEPSWLREALGGARRIAGSLGRVSITVPAGSLRQARSGVIREELAGWVVSGIGVQDDVVALHLRGLSTPEISGVTLDSIEGAVMLADLMATLVDADRYDPSDFGARTGHLLAQLRALPKPRRQTAGSSSIRAAKPPADRAGAPSLSVNDAERPSATPRSRRAVIAGGVLIWVPLAIAVGLLVGGSDGVSSAASLLALGAIVAVGLDARRRAIAAQRRHSKLAEAVGLVGARATERHREMSTVLDGVVAHIEDLGSREIVAPADVAALAGEMQGQQDLVRQDIRLVMNQIDDTYRQVEASMLIRDVVNVTGPTPPLRGWAVSPDLLRFLVEHLFVHQPDLIVECGSGASTVWLAMAIRTMGLRTRVVALEHDLRFATLTRQRLALCGVSDLAEVRHASLEPTSLPDFAGSWYATSALAGISDVGLVLVDGPPAETGKYARYPALPLLRQSLASNAVIVIDDTIREDERAVVRRWNSEFPEFEIERLPVEKGAAVLRVRTDSVAHADRFDGNS